MQRNQVTQSLPESQSHKDFRCNNFFTTFHFILKRWFISCTSDPHRSLTVTSNFFVRESKAVKESSVLAKGRKQNLRWFVAILMQGYLNHNIQIKIIQKKSELELDQDWCNAWWPMHWVKLASCLGLLSSHLKCTWIRAIHMQWIANKIEIRPKLMPMRD